MLYQDVVGPILEEVMSGYNCTVFAYGQTGTGKTHTMEGDLTSQMGTYSSEAGIIPRSLYRLFHTLELSKEDYSVKATFIELYNEELRDLLSPDNASSANDAAHHTLRMYDDARGKGVVIQGLEEVALKDAAHGLAVLRHGSRKRQIAATNCNEQSSRSHSVFTMTVFIKDKGSRGEDVLKIGKLNLVDLAGSENIGRSGAENKRAREAGMINQSLLTLGRVINALVEKNSHIPYRESKLTRLLQESLGGRTKTCIIATVSQERANIEETLSTLDYALRAKSIKNRPELNTRMTRSALIKEYVFEIERLKGDLQASRDQNGIYLTDDSWKTMHAEHEERKTLTDSLKRSAEVTESKLNSLKEQFEQNMQLLVKRDNEVRIAKAECADRVAELEALIAKAASLELTVDEEVALRKAYMASEAQLNTAASSLADLVHKSTADVQGLFDKLERKTAVEKANRAVVAECREAVSQHASQLDSSLSAFRAAENQFSTSLKTSLHNMVSATESHHDEHQHWLQARLKKISTSLREVRSGQLESKDVLASLLGDLEATVSALQTSSETSLGSLKQTCRGAIEDVVLANTQRFTHVAASFEQVTRAHVATLQEVQETNQKNRDHIARVKAAAEAASREEMQRLRDQNEQLAATVDEMKRSNASLKRELMADFGGLLDRFMDKQVSSVAASMAPAQALVARSINASESHEASQRVQLDTLSAGTGDVASKLERSQATLVEETHTIATDVSHASTELGTKMDAFASAIEDDLSALSSAALCGHDKISSFTEKARKKVEAHTKAQSSKIKAANTELTETLEAATSHLATSSQTVTCAAGKVVEKVDAHQGEVNAWSEAVGGVLKELASESDTMLASKFQEDRSTGQTPQKRVWKMPGRWGLVPSNREEAIEAGRKVVDTLVSEAATSEVLTSELEAEDGAVVEPGLEAEVEESAATPPVEGVEDGEAVRRSTRPLRELPFGHANVPSSTSMEELAIKPTISASRSAKNKLTASALPKSKRARS